MANNFPRTAGAVLVALALAACGGGGGGDRSGDGGDGGGGGGGGGGDGGGGDTGGGVTYALGGIVTGLTGTGLVIQNGADTLTLDAPGAFAFSQQLDDGADYDVEVVTQPANPENVCTVENGSGQVDGADVDDIEILCTGPLSLLSTMPVDGDPAVSRAVEPILAFSAEIDAASVAATSVSLESDAGTVDLDFDVNGATVTLTPTIPLLPLTDYTLTVTTSIEGTGGERLAEPGTAQFRTRDAAWLADVEIGTDSADTAEAQIAFDGEGNALAVWSQATLDTTDLWWNYYDADAGWGTPAPLEVNGDDLYAGGVNLGFDAAGHALAVWILTDSVTDTTSVRASRFDAATGWDKPANLESEAGTVFGNADMAINPDGDAVAVWSQVDSTTINLWSARYAAATGWDAPENIDESDHVVESPRVAINGRGDILAAWPMRDINNFAWDVWARRFTQASGWDDSKLLSEGNDFEALAARPVMDEDGNALVVWMQGLGIDVALFSRRYSAAGGWDAPEQLSVSAFMEDPEIALARDGNVIAVWGQWSEENGVPGLAAHSARYAAGAGWGEVEPISSINAFHPKIAIDASGNALATWYELDLSLPIADAFSVWGNRYVNGDGWTAAERIGSYGELIGTSMPNLAIDAAGDAFTIWTRGTEVRVNRFE